MRARESGGELSAASALQRMLVYTAQGSGESTRHVFFQPGRGQIPHAGFPGMVCVTRTKRCPGSSATAGEVVPAPVAGVINAEEDCGRVKGRIHVERGRPTNQPTKTRTTKQQGSRGQRTPGSMATRAVECISACVLTGEPGGRCAREPGREVLLDHASRGATTTVLDAAPGQLCKEPPHWTLQPATT